MPLRVGFVGLGNIGKPMAERLVAAGFETTVLDVDPAPVRDLVAKGARQAASPRELASKCDVIGVCVRDDRDVREVCQGEQGLFAGAAPGLAIAIHSTLYLETVLELGSAAHERGVGLIDACVTGGQAGAAAGSLIYLVGGESEDVERARPMLEASGERVFHAGALGAGTRLKLCNNVMTYLVFQAVHEAARLARAAGLSAETLEEVTRAAGIMSERMQSFYALEKLPEAARHSPDVQRLLAGHLALAEKDLAAALDLSRASGAALPATGLCAQLMAQVYGVDPATGSGREPS
jgi:3-hydroxyisobutyrate dehydrogenase-like beta-hydroxyacid dehydrogenase